MMNQQPFRYRRHYRCSQAGTPNGRRPSSAGSPRPNPTRHAGGGHTPRARCGRAPDLFGARPNDFATNLPKHSSSSGSRSETIAPRRLSSGPSARSTFLRPAGVARTMIVRPSIRGMRVAPHESLRLEAIKQLRRRARIQSDRWSERSDRHAVPVSSPRQPSELHRRGPARKRLRDQDLLNRSSRPRVDWPAVPPATAAQPARSRSQPVG